MQFILLFVFSLSSGALRLKGGRHGLLQLLSDTTEGTTEATTEGTTEATTAPEDTTTTAPAETEGTTPSPDNVPSTVSNKTTETTSAPVELAGIVKSSKLHSSLMFPISVPMPLHHLPPADFVAQYCEPKDSLLTGLPSLGTTGERYSAAVAEQMATLSVPSKAPAVPEPVPQPAEPYGHCLSDNDCGARRTHCVANICRECTPESIQSDCPNLPLTDDDNSDHCSAETHYTCSECLADSDCVSGGICRWVFPNIDAVPMMPRKLCTECQNIPASAELFDVATCQWRCPIDTTLKGNECVSFAPCLGSQYTGSTSQADVFYSPGVNTTDATCAECKALGPIDDPTFCADLTSKGAGDLGKASPCNHFECHVGYRLNEEHDQCLKCRYRSCAPGEFLSHCESDSAGLCTACNPSLVNANSTWVSLIRVPELPITIPESACLTVCKDSYYRLSTGECVSCDDAEAGLCRIGEIISECGPGTNSGKCVSCPPTQPSSYWTGHKCDEALCSARQCPAGTILTGCGGEKPGTCEPCPGGLPTGAADWTTGCAFRCGLNMFVDGKGCSACGQGNLCLIGEKSVGCGIDGITKGTCQKCPALSMGLYYKLGSECSPIRRDSSECATDQKLENCGYGDPGTCVSCGRGGPFTRRNGMDCQPNCADGTYAERVLNVADTADAGRIIVTPPGTTPGIQLPAYAGDTFTCKSCSQADTCSPGYYLSNCGSESRMGRCERCTDDLDDGEYWTGGIGCQTAQCSDIRCKKDEMLILCGKGTTRGGFGPGDCAKCADVETLPPNATGWTADNENGRTCVPICQSGYTENNKTCKSS